MGNPPLGLDKPPTSKQEVIWTAAILTLSNIGTLLKEVKEIIQSLTDIDSFLPKQIPFWVVEGVIGVAVVAGNVILFRFLFEKLKSRLLPGKEVIAALASALIISLIVAMNVLAIPKLENVPAQTQTLIFNELLSAQKLSEPAGFRTYENNQETRDDAWVTAQATKAILSVSDKLERKDRIKSAFRYLESKRLPDGWIADPLSQQPYVRTEISCWVALAYLQSLNKTGFWSTQEWNHAEQKATELVADIAKIQNSTGAWSPVIETDSKFDRTYPTLMAVWALSEAMRIEDLSSDLKASIGGNLDSGILWLIQKYHSGYGWDENPQLHIGEKFDGLTFEILFVLKRAEELRGHNSFKDSEPYRAIKRDIVSLFPKPFSIRDKGRIPPSDQNVNGKICWATFPAYPWSLAALSILADDPDIPSSDRRTLKRIKQNEIEELRELPGYLNDCETWEVAENVIGLEVMLEESKKK